MARRLYNPVALLHVIAMAALLVCLVSARERRMFGDHHHDHPGGSSDGRLAWCPEECDCKGLTVDCGNRALKHVPRKLPTNARRLHLEGNNISFIKREDFLGMGNLKILDLRQNQIAEVEDASFEGAFNLNELILFQNQLKHIRPAMFTGLKNLKALLLNANNISSVRRDAFSGLYNLNLLSLYDNKIQTLENGTFAPLVNIQTLHLGKNPFVCDCHLKWLGIYLQLNPIETSDARCEEPKRVTKRRISLLEETKFRCKGQQHLATNESGPGCPANCVCSGTEMRCGDTVKSLGHPLAQHQVNLDSSSESKMDDSMDNSDTSPDLYLDDIPSILPYDTDALYLCQKGKCVAVDKLNFECKCKSGWSGPLCHQAPTCQKKIYKDFYQEDGCRSVKELKLAECVGTCGDQCCRPIETKKRPVKMVCSDGSHYTKHIEIVRKCACDRKCAAA
ncbi:Slit -like protein 2 protein [Halotydeus destructor]|nr:Slit -like protein 2 protein [Halotydeus destructor]